MVEREGRLRWLLLGLASIALAGNYYASDSLPPVANLLRTQHGLSQSQTGLLNAVLGLPNIPLSLVGGLLIDRFGASRVGIGQETLLIALLAGPAQWFHARRAALAMSLLFSNSAIASVTASH